MIHFNRYFWLRATTLECFTSPSWPLEWLRSGELVLFVHALCASFGRESSGHTKGTQTTCLNQRIERQSKSRRMLMWLRWTNSVRWQKESNLIVCYDYEEFCVNVLWLSRFDTEKSVWQFEIMYSWHSLVGTSRTVSEIFLQVTAIPGFFCAAKNKVLSVLSVARDFKGCRHTKSNSLHFSEVSLLGK